jgi:hypothetical protein
VDTIPQIRIEDVSAATDELVRRSGKFSAFFSRAELEEHVCMALGKTRAAVLVPRD